MEVLATARRLDDRWGQAMMLALLGHVELAEGDLARAQEYFVEAAALFAALGNPLYLVLEAAVGRRLVSGA